MNEDYHAINLLQNTKKKRIKCRNMSWPTLLFVTGLIIYQAEVAHTIAIKRAKAMLLKLKIVLFLKVLQQSVDDPN